MQSKLGWVKQWQSPKLSSLSISALWKRIEKLPSSLSLLSFFVGRLVPYTGTMGAKVIKIQETSVVVLLPDRRRVRNHLNSIHAIALANLGELATGLALHLPLSENHRGILKSIEVVYLKKARGDIEAHAQMDPQKIPKVGSATIAIQAELRDRAKDVVAQVTAHWLVSPKSST